MRKNGIWKKICICIAGGSLLVTSLTTTSMMGREIKRDDVPFVTERTVYETNTVRLGGSIVQQADIVEKQTNGTIKTIKTSASADNKSFRRIITNSPKSALSQDKRETFVVLEIASDYTYTYIPWLVGGMEPVSQDVMSRLTGSDSGNLKGTIFGTTSTQYAPYTLVQDGYKKLELTPSEYTVFGSARTKCRADTGYVRVCDRTFKTETGYFKYVGPGKGLYELSNFKKSYVPVAVAGTGAYSANIDSYLLATDAQNPGVTYTGADYDLYYAKSTTSANGAMYAETGSPSADGTYIQKTDGNGFIYFEYVGVWNQSVPDPYAGTGIRCIPNFTSTKPTSGNIYCYFLDTAHAVFNPGKGQYKAALKGTPYTLTNKGNYNSSITNVDYRTCTLTPAQAGIDANVSDENYPATDLNSNVNTGYVKWSGGSYVWVGVSEEDAKNVEYTPYSAYETNSTTNIYMKNYKRAYAYYSANGYVNNEWFKALSLDVTDKLDVTLTDTQNYDAIKPSLAAGITTFDANYRMEVRTVSPDQVTLQDIKDANFVYVTEQPVFDNGVNERQITGLSSAWKDVVGLTIADTEFSADLPSFPMVLELYKGTFIDTANIRPVVLNATLRELEDNRHVLKTSSNMYKLFLMFNVFREPADMRQFVDVSGLRTFPELDGFLNEIDPVTGDINLHYKDSARTQLADNLLPTDLTESTAKPTYYWKSSNVWEREYFRVWTSPSTYTSGYKGTLFYMDNPFWNVNTVLADQHYLLAQWFGRGLTMDPNIGNEVIYRILRGWNKQGVVVDITNAEKDYNGRNLIYKNEFYNDYEVDYTVTSSDEIDQVQIYLDNNMDGMYNLSDTLLTTISGATIVNGQKTNSMGNQVYYYSGVFKGSSNALTMFPSMGVGEKGIVIRGIDTEGAEGENNVTVIQREMPDLN